MTCIEVENLHVAYGSIRALHGIDLVIQEGEIVSLLGANGAGKSTTLRALSRMIPFREGDIRFRGRSVRDLPAHRLVALGMAHVPEGRGIFPSLTVRENLALGAWTQKDGARVRQAYDQVFGIFPRLAERLSQQGGTLSGGEQQMLAVGRALMTGCRLMLLDEPSMGLSPLLVKEVFKALQAINAQGTTILLVEQNAHMALKIAHRGYVLENGRLVLEGAAEDLAKDPRVKEAYLGG
ncbi:ABC transporter ATP-binding protein [Mesoterricola silvestris]|uniref:ABC transporter ATP-binding protein n=1 Tax=Mesoterricola silvestris TaxID=2927979 RepID=A0AA48GPC0_9BACT|nr:ABC transporter ATP-binding protein [Mesoterricola silvestris]BDU71685.1 ABC transporter ATP-binding protein [Mesoterricola silvestris]